MVGYAARLGTVSVRLRRVAAMRAVRRLLVLGGLLIAAWLLGSAAQTAHADELPIKPSKIVEEAPVLGEVVKNVHRPEPVRRVVRAVAEKPRQPEAVQTVPRSVAAAPEVRKAAPETGPSAAPEVKQQARPRAPERKRVEVAAPVAQHEVSPPAVHDAPAPAPSPVPDRPDEPSAAGGSAFSGATAAVPNGAAWASVPPRASGVRVFGAVPPAVRTAADEPSFAPD
ncbi:hypothetical protein E1200_14420 [Actinomadura sp. GC306]|uniref:hypothetical protein n=1 Tax=Actinomadura sp. GC306 TaxID=2530367 RepID=UPI00104BA22A|nr:hypothetical protein [Actinomadura sp. GC306]TDC67624.1 hypothetical protein E1200_14420 [Actinomadura sp. GC306]